MILRVLFGMFCLALVGPVLSAPAAAAGGFGAIAIETGTWAFGFQVDAPDAATAKSQAIAACNGFTNGANDCIFAIDFSTHRCAAVAVDTNKTTFSWGRGSTQAEAGKEAVDKLNGFATVLVAQCNTLAQSSQATPTPAPFAPEPIRASVDIVGNDDAPLYITAPSIESRTDRTYLQCVSWRNLSNKEISSVKFDFRFYDQFNAAQPSFSGIKDGKYTPGILIENICWHGNLWSAAQIRQMRNEKIRLASVRYNDDTVWTPGVAWTKTFSTSGAQLAAAQPMAGGTAGTPGAAAPPAGAVPAAPLSVGGAVGGGGRIGGTGPAFGAVAMNPHTRIVGVATDAASPDAAVYDALSKCNAQTGGANTCIIMLKFSSPNKCAALAVDGEIFGSGVSPDPNNAVATALANLRANGGNIGNNIVAQPCNTR